MKHPHRHHREEGRSGRHGRVHSRDQHGEGHRGHGRGEGRGGPGRFFDAADLRHLILHYISEAPRHGYEIIKLIETQLAGAHTPSPGIIYPTLTMLEEMGLASITVEGTRKLYTITDDGKKELKANKKIVEVILDRLKQTGERHAQDRPAPILRAMENLKLVLRMRGGQLTPEQMASVTDIIDDAAKKIERL